LTNQKKYATRAHVRARAGAGGRRACAGAGAIHISNVPEIPARFAPSFALAVLKTLGRRRHGVPCELAPCKAAVIQCDFLFLFQLYGIHGPMIS